MESERPKKQHRPSQEGPEEVLRRLERRLDEASAAAERLIAEAAHAAASARSNEAARSASGSSGPVGAGEPRSAESAGSGAGTGDYRTPRAGWRTPEPGDGADRAVDLEPVLALLRSLRDLIPPELQRRLAEALRELLVALRALIDWYLERLEGRRTTAPDVQDIPIL